MNKQALIAKIAADTGSSKAGAAAAMTSLLEGITKRRVVRFSVGKSLKDAVR